VQDLLRNKSRLEHDLRVKANSLAIDKQKCLSNRRSFPYQVAMLHLKGTVSPDLKCLEVISDIN
jgi:hypothetical protein